MSKFDDSEGCSLSEAPEKSKPLSDELPLTELRRRCQEAGVAQYGTKSQMVERLSEAAEKSKLYRADTNLLTYVTEGGGHFIFRISANAESSSYFKQEANLETNLEANLKAKTSNPSNRLLRIPMVEPLFVDRRPDDSPYLDGSTHSIQLDQLSSADITALCKNAPVQVLKALEDITRTCYVITDYCTMSPPSSNPSTSAPPPITHIEFKPKSLYHSTVSDLPEEATDLCMVRTRYEIVQLAKGKSHITYHPTMFYQPYARDYSTLVDTIVTEMSKSDLNKSFSKSFVKFNKNHDTTTVKKVVECVSREHFGEIEALIKKHTARETLTWEDVGKIEKESGAPSIARWLGKDAAWWREGFEHFKTLTPSSATTTRDELLGVLTGIAWRDVSVIVSFRVLPLDPSAPFVKVDPDTRISDTMIEGARVEYYVKVIDKEIKHPKKLVGREALERGYILRAMNMLKNNERLPIKADTKL
ncbi:hypothetical protein TrVE_jg2189 [Triparma verrucosa]|uniref:Inositol-pentakisphosphate 2-kinase n=1 Tax=Triparma verrucosa TaxID=1606542 RepID=A0A9W7KVR5_9STRA|nr:hypothetical protein TrVE_jg2189 [Triparma verrucosa]